MLGVVLQASLFPCELPGAHFTEAGRDGRWKHTVLSSECSCLSPCSSSPAPPLQTLAVWVSGLGLGLSGHRSSLSCPSSGVWFAFTSLPSALLDYSTYLPLVLKETGSGAP